MSKNMIEGSYFAKSIVDASWNQFRQFLTYKAAEAGRKLGLMNPAYSRFSPNVKFWTESTIHKSGMLTMWTFGAEGINGKKAPMFSMRVYGT